MCAKRNLRAASQELTLREGLQHYFDQAGFSENNYSDPWIRLNIGPIPFYFPNSHERKRAVPFHDLHHVLTGYSITLLGEAEIGAWELASGCKDYSAAWLLNFLAVIFWFPLGPIRVWRAFLRGRRSKNLYGRPISNLLDQKVGALRQELGLMD